MRLLFDGTVYQAGAKYHGGGEYAIVIFRELLGNLGSNTVDVFFDPRLPRRNSFFELCKEAHVRMHAVSTSLQLRRLLERGNYNTLYSALPIDYYFQELMTYRGNTEIVITIHGLRGIEILNADMPLICRPGRWKGLWDKLSWIHECHQKQAEAHASYQSKIALCKNGTVITVSQHSKNSLLYHFPHLTETQIRVCYSPHKYIPENAGLTVDIFKKYKIAAKNYGLIISADREEKNALRGILAYDRLFSAHYECIPADYKVVVLGAGQKETFTKQIRNQTRFVFEHYVDAAELEQLYQHARLFLYPSLNEGFGYPPLEAMKYETLCACSAVTSIPEVCGDAVLYFNPICTEEIANRILQSFDQEIYEAKKPEMARQYAKIKERQEHDLKELAAFLLNESNTENLRRDSHEKFRKSSNHHSQL